MHLFFGMKYMENVVVKHTVSYLQSISVGPGLNLTIILSLAVKQYLLGFDSYLLVGHRIRLPGYSLT